MPSITIRDVPAAVRDELAARAARSGRSMQEFLLGELTALVQTPQLDDAIARIRERVRLTGTNVTTDEILAWRDSERR